MKQTAVLFAAILVLAAVAGAQANPDNSSLPFAAAASDTTALARGAPSLYAMATTPASVAANGLSAAGSGEPGSSSADQQPPSVYNVHENYNWQASAGYTFFRFYLVPNVTLNMNGLNLGMVYYPRGHWVGAEGEFIGAWGSIEGLSAKYVQGMGGPRFRWAAPRGLEVWGHGLVGGSHFLPQTALGSQTSFTYEVGGGVDLNIHERKIAYRVGADMVGTRYFGTYQYSPKVSVAIVFKF
jgi:hypothetical protein